MCYVKACLTDTFILSHMFAFTNAQILEEQNEENSPTGSEDDANTDGGDIETGLSEEVKEGEQQRSSSQSTGIDSLSSGIAVE